MNFQTGIHHIQTGVCAILSIGFLEHKICIAIVRTFAYIKIDGNTTHERRCFINRLSYREDFRLK